MINIVDFRDTDSTMTHWVNPDVVISGMATPLVTGTGTSATTTYPVPTAAGRARPGNSHGDEPA